MDVTRMKKGWGGRQVSRWKKEIQCCELYRNLKVCPGLKGQSSRTPTKSAGNS